MKQLVLAIVLAITGNTVAQNFVNNVDYVDMGLPSGTKWKMQNEKGLWTFDDAVRTFSNLLPTREQLLELRYECQWEWDGDGCKVTGPNGKSIYIPAAGARDCDGTPWDSTNKGAIGVLWSNHYISGDIEEAVIINFSSYGVGKTTMETCNKFSVRLCTK